jgi:hypothetical protein
VTHFILIVGLLAGALGWSHRDPETKAMCRCFGGVSAAVAFVVWVPAAIAWMLP